MVLLCQCRVPVCVGASQLLNYLSQTLPTGGMSSSVASLVYSSTCILHASNLDKEVAEKLKLKFGQCKIYFK